MSTKTAAEPIHDPGSRRPSAVGRALTPEELAAKDQRRKAKAEYGAQFGQRCRAARGAMEIGTAAERLGVHRNTVWNIERGDSLPDAYEIELMAKVYNSSIEFLLTGASGDAEASDVIPHACFAVSHGNFVYVPHFDVNASTGPGGLFNHVESVKAMRPFDPAYIRGELGIHHEQIGMISVIGSSMEPLLHSGDSVLVDLRASQEMFSDGIHVIRLDEALLVKQVQRLPGKVYRIRSLNPDYEPFEIKPTEETERDFAIIGRVRWGGVTIK